ncbi:MAG: hypothetical protein FVQ83_10320 [Chloroflexi bacterium]|nr:hypothetical protein [Chloroflexota bacterium]
MTARTNINTNNLIHKASNHRGLIFGVLIIGALFAFEIFNFSTTDFAMTDLLGDLKFAGIRWATILAFAFCGIDFAGIARLFTPEQGANEPAEVWYLFGAWLLAATMNAILTWWGVSIAILNHQSLGIGVIDSQTLLKVVPVFVAIMVWLIRVLIIGTFSVAGDRLFREADSSKHKSQPIRPNSRQTNYNRASSRSTRQPNYSTSFRPAPKSNTEPSYQQPSYSAKSNREQERRT